MKYVFQLMTYETDSVIKRPKQTIGRDPRPQAVVVARAAGAEVKNKDVTGDHDGCKSH